jgi:hypothetical protein
MPAAIAGGCVPCAHASVAMNPVAAQIAQDAKPANPRLVNMGASSRLARSSVSQLAGANGMPFAETGKMDRLGRRCPLWVISGHGGELR